MRLREDMPDDCFECIKQRSQEFFSLSHHDRFHVDRVYSLAVKIADQEHADLDVVKAAVLLHDIARAMEDEGKIEDHAIEGAKMARRILEQANFPAEKRVSVIHCIETHRFKRNMRPESLEAKILQDADRLDILGAIGVARVLARGGWSNMPIYDPSIPPKKKYDGESQSSVNHLCEKILKVRDTMNTITARKIAEERHKFVEKFLETLIKEWNGEL